MLFLILLISCARAVEPTVENINKIFASQDFSFEFHELGKAKKSISFREDYLVYKSDASTIRREITYDEVVLINNFIRKIVHVHQKNRDATASSHYIIKNTAYTTTIVPLQEDYYFEILLKTLQLRE